MNQTALNSVAIVLLSISATIAVIVTGHEMRRLQRVVMEQTQVMKEMSVVIETIVKRIHDGKRGI